MPRCALESLETGQLVTSVSNTTASSNQRSLLLVYICTPHYNPGVGTYRPDLHSSTGRISLFLGTNDRLLSAAISRSLPHGLVLPRLSVDRKFLYPLLALVCCLLIPHISQSSTLNCCSFSCKNSCRSHPIFHLHMQSIDRSLGQSWCKTGDMDA